MRAGCTSPRVSRGPASVAAGGSPPPSCFGEEGEGEEGTESQRDTLRRWDDLALCALKLSRKPTTTQRQREERHFGMESFEGQIGSRRFHYMIFEVYGVIHAQAVLGDEPVAMLSINRNEKRELTQANGMLGELGNSCEAIWESHTRAPSAASLVRSPWDLAYELRDQKICSWLIVCSTHRNYAKLSPCPHTSTEQRR